MEYANNNANPKRHTAGDCVIRAIAHATGYKWVDIFDDLTDIGRDMYRMPNEKEVYEKYLEQQGWQKHKMPRHENRSRYTVKQLADENPTMTAIVSIANHMTVLVQGKMHDTWNCSHKCVGNYYTKEN